MSEVFYLEICEYLLGLKVFAKLLGSERAPISGITFFTNKREFHLGGRSGYYDPYTLMVTDIGYPTTSSGHGL